MPRTPWLLYRFSRAWWLTGFRQTWFVTSETICRWDGRCERKKDWGRWEGRYLLMMGRWMQVQDAMVGKTHVPGCKCELTVSLGSRISK